MTLTEYLEKDLIWQHCADAELLYQTHVGAFCLQVRLNDFPAEPMYTLLIDGDVLGSFDDWPTAWSSVKSGTGVTKTE